MKKNAAGNYETTIGEHVVEIVKVAHEMRDRRRSCGRGTQRYATVYTWSSFVDGRLTLDGCATMSEAFDAAKEAAA